MSASADDLRYFYGAAIGDTETVAAIAASSTKCAAALKPGRYLLHFTALSPATAIAWVRQGPFQTVAAGQSAPSMPLSLDGIRAVEVVVRPAPTSRPVNEQDASTTDGIAVRMSAGATANLHITKISRGVR